MIGVPLDITDLLSFGGGTVLVLLFCAHFLVLEAIFLAYARRSASRSQLRRRLAIGKSSEEQQQLLSSTRHKRSLLVNDQHLLPLVWLNRLIVQSGVEWGAAWFPAVYMGISAVVSLPVSVPLRASSYRCSGRDTGRRGSARLFPQYHAQSPAPQATGAVT